MKNVQIENMLDPSKPFDALAHARLQGNVTFVNDFLGIHDMLTKYKLNNNA